MAPTRAPIFAFVREQLRLQSLLAYIVVFLACFVGAKFGQYLFYTQNTSPALLWPPFGIALAAMLVGGYRMWLPVALAELLAVYTSGMSGLPTVIAATIGQTLQPFVAAFVMRQVGFDNQLSRVRDAFILVAVAFIATMIAPTFTMPVEFFTHGLTASFAIAWTRTWAGGILSILILTPLITLWWPPRPLFKRRWEILEATLALASLCAVVVFIGWTTYGATYGLTSIYVLLAILVWISLRMEPRILALALFLLTALAVGGVFFLHAAATPLNQQLFGDELFVEFLAVIYLVFGALVEERRRARAALERNILELSHALERIEHEDIAKNQFIATLAHELRNPLAPVVSALDLLSMQTMSQEAMQTIEGAQRELNVMRRLLDDILDVARVSQNRFKLQKEIIDVRPLLERCVESTRVFLRNRKHILNVTLARDAVIVEVDPVRFQQIVVNLLNNAGKYTPPGGKIELSCAKAGAMAVIQVRDNGVGIPQESLNEVFEPFRQIRPTPQMGTGLGIGLWLTKRLVDMHGGTIEAQSEGAERGSCFSIYLPLRENAKIDERPAMKVASVIPPFKILIVDDNEAAAQAMQKLLRLKGHDARIAYDGKSGIAESATFSPRVVLLDIGLPDMSGYDVVKVLRELPAKATLIALTGYGQEEDKEKAKQAGFDYHLTKPVGIADIERVLAQIVG